MLGWLSPLRRQKENEARQIRDIYRGLRNCQRRKLHSRCPYHPNYPPHMRAHAFRTPADFQRIAERQHC